MKIKTIKLKIKPVDMQIILQNWIIDKKITNAGLISIALHSHIRRFIKDLQEVYLSKELQNE